MAINIFEIQNSNTARSSRAARRRNDGGGYRKIDLDLQVLQVSAEPPESEIIEALGRVKRATDSL